MQNKHMNLFTHAKMEQIDLNFSDIVAFYYFLLSQSTHTLYSLAYFEMQTTTTSTKVQEKKNYVDHREQRRQFALVMSWWVQSILNDDSVKLFCMAKLSFSFWFLPTGDSLNFISNAFVCLSQQQTTIWLQKHRTKSLLKLRNSLMAT